ncbi:aminotransferase class V-fold PLP-dependent enzyme [Geminicoccaceae bacterium 1502E]|nr:aminotransferase class V-fold PLP-dependent enzyme [Geminicoccaceae bacterium 1502E]
MQQLAQALAVEIRPGDEIVLTDVDHESNTDPWHRLARDAELRVWRIDPERLELEPEALEALLSPRTRLVCITHCSNVPGTMMPVAEIARRAPGTGAIPAYLDELARHHGAPDPFAVIGAQEEALSARLLDYLCCRSDVRIIGRREPDRAIRVPTISFVARNRLSSDIVAVTDRHRIGIRHGDFYAREPVHNLGLAERHGVVRVSMIHDNTAAEVDRLVAALD